jgi:N-glycosylase/DNA lyase
VSTQQSKKYRALIRRTHDDIAGRIEERLGEFRGIWERGDDRELFIELVFCLLTPQSGARRSWRAVQNMLGKGHLFTGGFEEISGELNIVRFKNHKASYILEAREAFVEGGLSLKKILGGFTTSRDKRQWIAGNIKGLGFKEASHYLRNIGLGDDIAILDRHILRSMRYLGLIGEIPPSISPRIYLVLEERLARYAAKSGIPLGHLDFVLWFIETGDLFK